MEVLNCYERLLVRWKVYLQKILVFILTCLSMLIFTSQVLAFNWGQSCSGAGVIGSGLANDWDSAYGFVVNSIDMTASSNYCDATQKTFTLCIKQDKSGTSCANVSPLNVGDKLDTSATILGTSPLLKNIDLRVKAISRGSDTLLCLMMPTSQGPQAVACKLTTVVPPPPPPDQQCKNIGKSCYTNPMRSQSLFNFSGLAIDCVKETLDMVFFHSNICNVGGTEGDLAGLNPFSSFQESLKTAIRAALMLYVIVYAVNMMLNQGYGNLDKLAMFVLKLVLVLYFSVGLGPIFFKEGVRTTENGMLKYGLPILTAAAPEFAQIIFNSASRSGLCRFEDSKYADGYQFYGLWDSIDCRIAYYLGLGLVYNTSDSQAQLGTGADYGISINVNGTRVTGDAQLPSSLREVAPQKDNIPSPLTKASAFRYFTVMFGFLLAGNVVVVIAGMAFIVVFLSIMLFFISHYLVCMVTIYVMTYISPIFIPMVLFNRTKEYFNAWVKICLSCALQPAVVAGFISILVALYDQAIYKTCVFRRFDHTYGTTNFSTFELRTPDPSGCTNGNASECDPAPCEQSFGYKMLQYYSGIGWQNHIAMLFSLNKIDHDTVSMLGDLLYVMVFAILFYYFSKQISVFAGEVTSGPVMDGVTVSPTKIVDLVKKGIDAAISAAAESQGVPPEAVGGSGVENLAKDAITGKDDDKGSDQSSG